MLPGVLGTLSSFATSQVNDIRRSLAVLARDSTAFGLPQPHLNRTGLCDIPESSFDPNYINARDQLRLHLHSSARGKRMGGEFLDGAGLADLVESLVQVCAASIMQASWAFVFSTILLWEKEDDGLCVLGCCRRIAHASASVDAVV